MSFIPKILCKQIFEVSNSYKVGLRTAKISKCNKATGSVLGVKQVYKKLGPIPIIAGAAMGAAVPIPGAMFTGIVIGNMLKKGSVNLFKLLKP